MPQTALPSPARPPRTPPGARLLAWYEQNRRPLPWRETRDPYRIWLSEVLLQQTRIETGIPYYERFLARFPTVESLARAALDDVLSAWSGLGYYRRARLLHRAAQTVVESGGLPRTAAGLEALPGIGPYTAAAIASIAFGEVVPVLDGNVIRLLARWTAEPGDAATSAVRRRLLATAATLLDHERPGDSNQALMELGATVCVPARPRCASCPLRFDCAAQSAGQQERYPVRAQKLPSVRVQQVAAALVAKDQLFLARRGAAEEQLAGLWEVPLVEAENLASAQRALGERYGGEWKLGRVVAELRHAITRRTFAIEVRQASRRVADGELREGVVDGGWFSLRSADTLALTGVARKVLAVLLAPAEPG